MCRAPVNFSAVFDHFASDTSLLHDSLMMETAAAQCLLLAGFFEDLHNARLLDAIARRFELWRQRHAKLSRELRDQPFLLITSRPRTPP